MTLININFYPPQSGGCVLSYRTEAGVVQTGTSPTSPTNVPILNGWLQPWFVGFLHRYPEHQSVVFEVLSVLVGIVVEVSDELTRGLKMHLVAVIVISDFLYSCNFSFIVIGLVWLMSYTAPGDSFSSDNLEVVRRP